MVAKRYGIEVKEKEMTEEEVRRNDDRESMFALNGWAAEYFANYLHRETEGQSVGLAYFRQKRGMTDATIRKFGLGFCPAKGDRMSKDALAAGYKQEFLVSTGLSLQRESDGSLYDRFRDRVIFPVHNISGRIVRSEAARCAPTSRWPSTRTPPRARYTARNANFTVSISPRRPFSNRISPSWSKDTPM